MNLKTRLLGFFLVNLVLFFPQQSGAISLEELAETFCDYYDGVDCSFDEDHAIYKFGPHHAIYGGSGKIRSQSAYCLIRDGNGQMADATFGEADTWKHFGAQSRFHITYAGKDSTDLYRAEGQRVLDLILLGHTLEGAEVQDLLTNFPVEKEKSKRGPCKKWMQVGKKKICTQFDTSLSLRSGYYMPLDTHFYNWEIDVDEVLSDLSQIFGGPSIPDGFEMGLGQDVPFEYYGTTELDGTDLILNDGMIPSLAYSGNIWEWGRKPDEETATSYLNIEFPAATVRFASLTLLFDLELNGYYALEEGPIVNDPDTGQLDNPPDYDEKTTSTHLAGGTKVNFTLEACLDFGWFGTWCGDFNIVDADKIEKKDPLNIIAYSARGVPSHVLWANGQEAEGARDTHDQINACMNAEPLIQEPEEPATPADWLTFLTGVAQTADEHYEPCSITQPSNTVNYTEPGFKLCDSEGTVFETTDGFFQK